MPDIEVYRGQLPRCRQCGRHLRPNYETVTRRYNEPARHKKVWLGAVDKNQQYLDDPERDPYELNHPWPFAYDFDAEKGQYYRLVEVGRIKSRRFKGTFGPRGNGYFCTVECGFRWAVIHHRQREENP